MDNNNFLSLWWPEFVANMRNDGLTNQEISNFLMKMYLEKDMTFDSINELAIIANLKLNKNQFEEMRQIYLENNRPKISRSSFDENGNIILR